MFSGRLNYFRTWLAAAGLGAAAGTLLTLLLTGILSGPAPRPAQPPDLIDGGGRVFGETGTSVGSPARVEDGKGKTLPPAAANPIVEIARLVGPAVVGVTNIREGGLLSGARVNSGSGTVVDGEKGYVVTNFHVVDGADRLLVSRDEATQSPARLVGTDRRTDLAVLQVQSGRPLPAVRFGRSADLQVGETVVAIGNPLGREFARSVTVGVVSASNRLVAVENRPGEAVTLRVLQTDAAINPGNSGGALVNTRGEVIGINSVKIARPDVEGMGFALPSDDALPIVRELVSRGYVSRPFLGIYDYSEITPELARAYDLSRGVLVGGVVADGPAARAGVKPGDILTGLNGSPVRGMVDLMEVLGTTRPDQKLGLRVQRAGRNLSLQLVLGELPRD